MREGTREVLRAFGKSDTKPWEYAYPTAAEDPVWDMWRARGRVPPNKTHFHYQLKWRTKDNECRFTAIAFGDLDDDGIYSTYEQGTLVRDGEEVETIWGTRKWDE